tara:strand:+ start:756 stop:899 length:144 start_codon:yes stop_codon:yes gene_type:complete
MIKFFIFGLGFGLESGFFPCSVSVSGKRYYLNLEVVAARLEIGANGK